jgi:polysaccharide export outer membrane protein
LLSGCAVSSFSSNDFGNEVASSGAATTASVTPAADTSSPGQPSDIKVATTATAQQTSARASVAALTASSTPGSSAYKIGPQDVVDISVFKVAELSRTAQVSEAGTISFPLVGEVMAAGKTARELEKELTTQLGGKYLQKPQVAVMVKEFNSQRITVEGAVKRPGVFPMQGSLSLLQAVALAQGFDQISDETVVVVRTSNGKRSAARFDVGNIRSGTTQDPPLQAGDILIAGTSTLKEGLNFLKGIPLTSAFALL